MCEPGGTTSVFPSTLKSIAKYLRLESAHAAPGAVRLARMSCHPVINLVVPVSRRAIGTTYVTSVEEEISALCLCLDPCAHRASPHQPCQPAYNRPPRAK